MESPVKPGRFKGLAENIPHYPIKLWNGVIQSREAKDIRISEQLHIEREHLGFSLD